VKDLRGDAAGPVPASSSECFELVVAVEGYPEWHPDVVRRAAVTQHDAEGRPARAIATVHLGIGPLRQDLSLDMGITAEPERLVRLSRIPHKRSDPEEFVMTWVIEPGPTARLAIELRARLDLPRFLPLHGVGDSMAQGFLSAAQAELERRAG
jgi:ribosome-associated toxin RatA of RatAB toxin-antitoxin module